MRWPSWAGVDGLMNPATPLRGRPRTSERGSTDSTDTSGRGSCVGHNNRTGLVEGPEMTKSVDENDNVREESL